MKVFKKVLLVILIFCITCTSTPIYAFGELINQEKEAEESNSQDAPEKNSSEEVLPPVTEENKTPEIEQEDKIPETEENLPATEESKTPTTTPNIDGNESSVTEEENNSLTPEDMEDLLNKREHITENSILSKKGKKEQEKEEDGEEELETKLINEENLEIKLLRTLTANNKIQEFLDSLTGITKFDKEENQLHFIIKHWHHTQMAKNEDSEEHEETTDSENLVTLEGYIEKVEEGTGYNVKIRKDLGSYHKITNENLEDFSNYVESVDTANGKIILKASPLEKDGKPLEHFTAFAVGSGRKAVDENEEQEKVTVSYKEDTHLVKIHTYYINENMIVAGSSDNAVFGTNEETGSLEKDTALVYTYKNVVEGHQVGEIVKTTDDKPVYEGEQLPEGVTLDNVELTKVYSTVEGLHTDKSIRKINEDEKDRKFTIDLESWFSGAKAVNVGLLLDASGSMTFTSDTLDPINIDDRDLNLSSSLKQDLRNKALTSEKYIDERTYRRRVGK